MEEMGQSLGTELLGGEGPCSIRWLFSPFLKWCVWELSYTCGTFTEGDGILSIHHPRFGTSVGPEQRVPALRGSHSRGGRG
jgi:hypothetical protein